MTKKWFNCIAFSMQLQSCKRGNLEKELMIVLFESLKVTKFRLSLGVCVLLLNVVQYNNTLDN